MMPDEIAVKLTETEQRSKSNTHRLDAVEKRQDDLDRLVASVAVLANRQENIESDVKEIKSDVKDMMSKPARRWESVVMAALGAIIAGIIGYAMYRLGMGA